MNSELIDLSGKSCLALVARAFWLKGKQVSELSVLFLKTEDASWYRICFNDEEYRWELRQTGEVPVAGQTLGDEEFSYPQFDVGTDLGLAGAAILSFTEKDTGAGAEARLRFENGRELVLFYRYDDEATQMTCQASS